MTVEGAGMTVGGAGMTVGGVGMTVNMTTPLGRVDAKIQAMTVRRFPLQSTASNDEKRLPSDDLPQCLRRNAGTGISAPSVKSLGVNTP